MSAIDYESPIYIVFKNHAINISGVDPTYHDQILRFFKNTCYVNGTVLIDPIFGPIIHIIGDYRYIIVNFLINQQIATNGQIMLFNL